MSLDTVLINVLPIVLKECNDRIATRPPRLDGGDNDGGDNDGGDNDGGNDNDDNEGEDGGVTNRWMWHSGAVAESSHSSSAMYCPPSNAES